QLERDAVNRILDISIKIREAIRNSLPTPVEQVLTVMVPGKVVNLDDYVIDPQDIALPLTTQLNQSILCDDMPTMSTIQIGPTGKSVAASYNRLIGTLVTADAGSDKGDGATELDGDRLYNRAMKELASEVPDGDGGTTSLMNLYTKKHMAYVTAYEQATQAFQRALEISQTPKGEPRNKMKEAYARWIQEHSSTYRSNVQAAYIDWVINGRKADVEFWFSHADRSSALARVQQSKGAMRNSIIQDDSGWEYNKVTLEPSDWANKCNDKIKQGPGNKSAEWYTWEIRRLEQTNSMLNALKTASPSVDPETAKPLGPLDAEIKVKQTALATAKGSPDSPKPDDDEGVKSAKLALSKAQNDYDQAKAANDTLLLRNNQKSILKKALEKDQFVESQITQNNKLIDQYKGEQNGNQHLQFAALQSFAAGAEPYKDLAGYLIPRDTETKSKSPPAADYFTSISVEISKSSDSHEGSNSAVSASLGLSAAGVLWKASVSAAHSQTHSKVINELSSCSVKISFDCMRVDITRSWLRPEIFVDDQLTTMEGVTISPGYSRLRDIIEGKGENLSSELSKYAAFPFYPVAFLVACGVVLEITGSTANLETYMNTSNTSFSASVSYGPFSVSPSGAYSSSDDRSTCQKTDYGCRIEIKAPQIIAWISQLTPELPRPSPPKD
ncbi:hypothetical protein BDV93DRAFT_425680, partial [Ceratobasidium sp. AG-I]